MSAREARQLYTKDRHFALPQVFHVLEQDVIVCDECIANALHTLPKSRRDIVLLACYLEMPDSKIGDKLSLQRSTVQYQRTASLKQLKKHMEETDHA